MTFDIFVIFHDFSMIFHDFPWLSMSVGTLIQTITLKRNKCKCGSKNINSFRQTFVLESETTLGLHFLTISDTPSIPSCMRSLRVDPRNTLMWLEATLSATKSTVLLWDAGRLWKKFSSNWCCNESHRMTREPEGAKSNSWDSDAKQCYDITKLDCDQSSGNWPSSY